MAKKEKESKRRNLRLLVCGGRDFKKKKLLTKLLDEFGDDTILIHGNCPTGADFLANEYAEKRGWAIWKFPAQWDRYGRSAGPRRNQRMLDESEPDYVLAFKGGYGTRDMVSRSERAEVPKVRKVNWE